MTYFKTAWHNSALKRLFNFKSEEAKGRSCMLASAVLSGIVTNITGGIFYTGYLVQYGITIINIGILTFIPFIATGFSLLSPMILERLPRRKKILAASRMVSYSIKILGIILLPHIVHSEGGRNIGFALIVFSASAINSLFSAGWSVWHINFLPESMRADYFNVSSAVANLIVGIITLLGALMTDALAGSEHHIRIITVLYIIGFLFAVLDVAALSLPKEYEYERSVGKNSGLINTIRLAFGQKKFMLTMYIMFGYTFASNLTASVINVHLLENVEVSYTFVTGVNSSYFLFFLLFGTAAKKLIARFAWFKTFAIAVLLLLPTYFMYAFVDNGNYHWLMLIVRLTQHFLGVMIAITYANFPYINLPPGDRTNYMSFYAVFINLAALLAMLIGTGFVSRFGERSLELFGKQLGSIQMLMLITGLLLSLLAVVVLRWIPRITPDENG